MQVAVNIRHTISRFLLVVFKSKMCSKKFNLKGNGNLIFFVLTQISDITTPDGR